MREIKSKNKRCLDIINKANESGYAIFEKGNDNIMRSLRNLENKSYVAMNNLQVFYDSRKKKGILLYKKKY
jgi:hypothetical protein